MGNFRFLEHGADVAFEARGESLEELFRQAARAMYASMLNLEKVSPKKSRAVRVEAPDLVILLHDWLSELLFITDTEGLVFSDFDVKISQDRDGEYLLEATARGELVDPERHEAVTEIKAVTYHGMDVYEEGGEWVARVILDV